MSARVLDKIVESTLHAVESLRAALPEDVGHQPIDVVSVLRRPVGVHDGVATAASADRGLRLIAEIKKRSPSAGALSRVLSVADRARVYERAGARMISVLVDRDHFDGGYPDLAEARRSVSVPLLCKGFIIDPVQITAARRAGADAILLIARILSDDALARLHNEAKAAGLTPIVEVISEAELSRALAVDAQVIGVNARDLDTLAMDRALATRVVTALAAHRPGRISLFFSGLRAPGDVAEVAAQPVDGALIGEVLMRSDHPEPLLRALVASADGPT